MAKLEFTPVFTWQNFNFLGKRLFDFLNFKLNATTRGYGGNGTLQEIPLDIFPRLIIVFSLLDGDTPVIWIDTFGVTCKDFDGNNLVDGIMGLNPKKSAFIVGANSLVNGAGQLYNFVAIGD